MTASKSAIRTTSLRTIMINYVPILIEGDPITGCSAESLVEVGKKKGYELITHCGNVFFVVKELYPILGIEDNSLEKVFDYNWIRGLY